MRTLICLLIGWHALALSQEPSTKPESSLSPEAAAQLDHLLRERGEQEKLDGQALGTWQHTLNQNLLNHPDPYFKALAYFEIMSRFTTGQMTNRLAGEKTIEDDQVDWSIMANLINQLIHSEGLESDTLSLLDSLCFWRQIEASCDQKTLIEKRIQASPENLIVYFRPLALAAGNAQDSELVNKLMNLMAQSQVSHLPTSLKPEFYQHVEAHIQENPFSDAAIRAIAEEYRQAPSGLSDAMKAQMDQKMPTAMAGHVKSTYLFATEVPPMRTLLTLCQEEAKLSQQCIQIAQTMIRNSDNMLSKGVGFAVALGALGLSQDQDQLNTVIQGHQKFKKSTECLRELSNSEAFLDSLFDPIHQDIVFSHGDDGVRLLKLAEHQYKIRLETDPQSAKNPARCFD